MVVIVVEDNNDNYLAVAKFCHISTLMDYEALDSVSYVLEHSYVKMFTCYESYWETST